MQIPCKRGKGPKLFQSLKHVWRLGSERKSLQGYRSLLNWGLGSTTLQKAELRFLQLSSCIALLLSQIQLNCLTLRRCCRVRAARWGSESPLLTPPPTERSMFVIHRKQLCCHFSKDNKATSHVVKFSQTHSVCRVYTCSFSGIL